jgi:sugar-specific transcriptional regulator TrmB
MLNSQLIELFDLNEKDVDVYLDLLRHGSSAASTISVRTQIERTSVYSTLKRLTQKGLVSYHFNEQTQHYRAVTPQVLKRLIDDELQKVQLKKVALNELLPKLQKLAFSQNSSPSMEFFEGASGVISLYETMLSTSKTHCAFLTVENLPKAVRPYLTDTYIKNKIKKGVSSRVLVSDSKRASHYQELDKKGNRSTKIISKEFLPFETEIIIGETDLAIIDLKNRFFGIYLKSNSIRNTMQALFETLWTLTP